MFAGASVDDSAYTGDMNDYTIAGKWWQESWNLYLIEIKLLIFLIVF